MSSPLLSICIPTYNRSHYLKRCLESIVEHFAQSPQLKTSVEVVVSDNCSTDDTESIVRSFAEQIPLLVYHKNAQNVGFDRNIESVVKAAHGTFCWYLGDDDLIIPGGLLAVHDKFATDTYDLITMNSAPLWEGQTIETQTYTHESFVELQDHNEFYFRVYCQGGVSVLAFRRELWLRVMTIDDYLEHWLYFETVLKVLAQSKKPKVFVTTSVLATGQDCRWAENGTELFTFVNSIVLLEKMKGYGFDKGRLEKEIERNSRYLVLMLLRAKGHGLPYNIKNLTFIYRHMKNITPFQTLVAAVIYFIPNPIIIWVRDFRKSLIKV